MFGFLNVYKPKGMTSHDVVAKLRKITKIRQIGHTGTLDPFAEGVLPVCIGKATRLIEYLNDDKEYIATVQFGAATSTYDLEGEKVFTSDKKVCEEDVVSALKNFEGDILQTPPIYSAIKLNGKKLYEYAREGKNVEIAQRKVNISKIVLSHFDEKLQVAEIVVRCSKGTYIRSIANDLGKILGCGGYLIKLVRTVAGDFTVDSTVELNEEIDVGKNLINPLNVLQFEKIKITDDEFNRVKNGNYLQNKNIKTGDKVILIYNENEICAIGVADDNKIMIKKVFL